MSQNITHCRLCKKLFEKEQRIGTSIVCSCGWSVSLISNQFERRLQYKMSLIIVSFACLLLGIFYHAVNWDNYFFKIIPLQVKQMVGRPSVNDLYTMIEICQARQKHSCVRKAYQDIYQINKDISVLTKLGQFFQSTNNFSAAAYVFHQYFILGGSDKKLFYEYAQTLNAIGKTEEAIKYYQKALEEKNLDLKTFILITRNYISLLIKNEKYVQAKKMLENYRQQTGATRFFMEKEYQALNRILQQHTIIKKRAAYHKKNKALFIS